MYVCAGFSQINAKSPSPNIPTRIGLVSRIYQCQSSLKSPLLAAYTSQENQLPVSVKPVAPLLLNNCDELSSSKDFIKIFDSGTLSINGDISITESKNIAITGVTSLSDITVTGTVQISFPKEGSFTINGTAYTTSPIAGLTLNQNEVQIDCDDDLKFCGVYIGADVTLDVNGDIAISNNTVRRICPYSAVGVGARAFSVLNEGSIISSGAITISDNIARARCPVSVLNNGSIISSGSITMSDNIVNKLPGQCGGFSSVNSGIIKTGGNFILTLKAQTNTLLFSSSDEPITDLTGTALSFNQFTITINTDQYGSSGGDYSQMQEAYDDLVVLNVANQS